jgi:16S rRNA (uracil1498-N3)-methyltransferase
MSAPPFLWAPPESWSELAVALPPEESHHVLRVLRLRVGDELAVIDGAGRVARCLLDRRSDSGGVEARVLEVSRLPRPRLELVVYQGAAKGAKADAVTERLAALGVAEMHVFSSWRALVSWDGPKRRRLEDRWRALARAAAKQSRSPWVMSTGAPLEWPELVASVRRERLPLVLWEEAHEPARGPLAGPLAEPGRVALIVGPEGGLAQGEAEELSAAGAHLVSLGPRILRTEEAAVVAAAGVLWHFGAIG